MNYDFLDDETILSSTEKENFVFDAAGWIIPDPNKKGCCEDAYFISKNIFTNSCMAVGIADGVGGWGTQGNSAVYARSLMEFALKKADSLYDRDDHDDENDDEFLSSEQKNSSSEQKNSSSEQKNSSSEQKNSSLPVEIMSYAYNKIPKDLIGSSTACVMTIINNYVEVANLGDSGFMIIRMSDYNDKNNNKDDDHSDQKNNNHDHKKRIATLIHSCKGKQIYFNCPEQLGTNSNDTPLDSILHKIPVEENDIIVLCTDGVFDNMTDEQILLVVGYNENKSCEEIAMILTNKAHMIANNGLSIDPTKPKIDTPFSIGAKEAGIHYEGGKMDDITAVVCKIKKI